MPQDFTFATREPDGYHRQHSDDGFDFVMYLVEDMKRARTFYEELFG